MVLDQFLANELLRPLQHFNVVLRDHGDGTAGLAGARRPTHAVHVVLRVVRNIVIDDKVDGRDVEAARRHVRRDEDTRLTRLELVEGGEPLVLRQLAVDVNSLKVQRPQQQGQLQRGVARRGEHEGLLAGELRQQVNEIDFLVLGGDENVVLHQRVDRLVLRVDLDLDRVPQ